MAERKKGEEGPSKDMGVGGEDTNPAGATPPISAEDVVEDQTQVPAADDDVGVPPDEEMNRES